MSGIILNFVDQLGFSRKYNAVAASGKTFEQCAQFGHHSRCLVLNFQNHTAGQLLHPLKQIGQTHQLSHTRIFLSLDLIRMIGVLSQLARNVHRFMLFHALILPVIHQVIGIRQFKRFQLRPGTVPHRTGAGMVRTTGQTLQGLVVMNDDHPVPGHTDIDFQSFNSAVIGRAKGFERIFRSSLTDAAMRHAPGAGILLSHGTRLLLLKHGKVRRTSFQLHYTAPFRECQQKFG